MKLKHIIILQNKIDLVKESQAKEQYDQILKFVQGEWVCMQYINSSFIFGWMKWSVMKGTISGI